MEYSNFGKEFKKILIEKNMRLYDIANELGVSSSFVSAVICGKRGVPTNWFETIKETCNLSDEEITNLKDLANENGNICRLNLANASNLTKSTAYAFQRNLNNLDDETLKKIKSLIEASDFDD